MFSFASINCRPCGVADPKTDTIKVDLNLPSQQRGKENAAPAHLDAQHQEAQKLQAQRLEAQRMEAQRIEAQRRREAEEAEERQRRELEVEQERRRRRQMEEEAEAERRREQEAAARRMREEEVKREAEKREAEELARRKQRAAEAERLRTEANKKKVEEFLKANSFVGVNGKRRSMLKSFYPLHVAVSQKNAEAAALLIWAGADPTLKNSAGLTPLQLAQKSNKQGSHSAIINVLAPVSAR